MSQSSRQIVIDTLKFNYPQRLPRDIWILPWAQMRYPEATERICNKYPSDIAFGPNIYKPALLEKGDPYKKGTYICPWGCESTNLEDGIVGEVKKPVIHDLKDTSALHLPYETLPQGIERQKAIDEVNKFCDESDKFVIAAYHSKPWEQYQALRTTVNAMMDIAEPEKGVIQILKKMQEFYITVLEFWADTNVDALMCMDDWGSQANLQISPQVWRDVFKPLYKDYAQIAHSKGKFLFMHSDGCILDIYPDLIEVGIDALNSQLFCMDMAKLAEVAKGKITFWGEIDRQHILGQTDLEKTKDAVNLVAEHLYTPAGGIIIQFSYGLGIYPPNAEVICEQWQHIHNERREIMKS